MKLNILYEKALNRQKLNLEEALLLYEQAPFSKLMFIADEIRKKIKNNEKHVGWIIDRNVNLSNVCIAGCKFCNFHRKLADPDTYVTTIEEYRPKIEELLKRGGNQLLLQGGLHPKLKLSFYTSLFSMLKKEYPQLKLHALGPAEIHHLARMEKLTYKEVLEKLMEAGLDSLPGAGAEILSDRVRKIVSPGKCTAQQWLSVMQQAHILNLPTSATMMFGFIETKQERIEHLLKIRDLQDIKPDNSKGFITFVPWIYQAEDTILKKLYPDIPPVSGMEYIRLVAISRIILNNIDNIQASWLTVGKETGQISLHAGANDFGSIMIEENVVSAAGASHQFDETGIQQAIKQAGFIPRRRNQKYEWL